MQNKVVGFTIGILLLIIGAAELIPAIVDYTAGHSNAYDFLGCSIVTIFFGGALVLSNHQQHYKMNLRETFLLTTLSWLALSFFTALPLHFSDVTLSYTDAVFEAVSGITTTGSTVLSGLDEMSHGVLLWRSIIQWIGGIGIVAFAIVVLPFLRVGGMQLFKTESSDRSDKVMPKTLDLISSLLFVYCTITLLCVLTYIVLGMNTFNAVNHAFTTISTGGYSTHDASFGYYDNALLQYAAAFFMLLGSVPFILFVKWSHQGKFHFFKDEQCRVYLKLLCVLIAFMSVWLWFNSDYSAAESLQHVTFNIISVITTTGYATADYTKWGGLAVIFFFFLTYLGACSGSTSGGIKIMRLIIVTKLLHLQIKRLIFPSAAFAVRYQKRVIKGDLMLDVMGFMGLFVVSNVVLTVLLALIGLDFETSLSGAATALANVGPGIGNVIGPAGNFSSLPDSAKWLLSAGMILGRLEIMTVMVLFTRHYWRE